MEIVVGFAPGLYGSEDDERRGDIEGKYA